MLEDDGHVSYAYLLVDGDIVSDVWLYNVQEDPLDVDWSHQTELPLCNPKRYCTEESLPRLAEDMSVNCLE
jgi:hypothetical protein